jgi:hypothetical protein
MKIEEKIRLKLLKVACESQQPSEGVWYLIYLKPNWIIRAYKDIDYPNVDHVKVWSRDVSHIVAEHYKTSQKEIEMHPYAFPRGRVVNINPSRKGVPTRAEMYGDKWAMYFGDDLPGGAAKWKAKILNEFDLSWTIGRIEWRYDDHEIRQDEDVRSLSVAIGVDLYRVR